MRNPRKKVFSPKVMIGRTTFGRSPVYVERLTISELKQSSPKSRGERGARQRSDIHLLAAKAAKDNDLMGYHYSMAGAYSALANMHERGPDPYWQESLKKDLKFSRLALDDYAAKYERKGLKPKIDFKRDYRSKGKTSFTSDENQISHETTQKPSRRSGPRCTS